MSMSTHPDMPAAPAWTVIGQIETVGQDQAGNYVQGRQVNFQLADGATGSVFVPNSQYTPEAVKGAIMRMAALIHQVNNLSHGG